MESDSFRYCTQVNHTCNNTIESELSVIYNDLIEMYYKNYSSLSDDDKIELATEIEMMTELYRERSINSFFEYIK